MKKLSKDDDLKYKYFKNVEEYYLSIIKDISKAKFYVYVEVYRYDSSNYAKLIRDALEEVAERGVEVKILIDGWGTQVDEKFFSKLIHHGGEVRFFRKTKFLRHDFIKYNNRRDHRKIVVIDDKIVYLSSANIASRNLAWREFCIKIEGYMSGIFKDVFLDNYGLHENPPVSKREHIFPLRYGTFEIIRDVPSFRFRMIRKKLKYLITNSKKEIIIETPYLVPDHRFLRALKDAARRGVKVTLIIPRTSDVKVVDMMASSYLGGLHESGVHILYSKQFLHAKVSLIDNTFSFGSANIDHRSFSYMYELNVFSTNKELGLIVRNHINETLALCEEFNFKQWKNRPLFRKFMEIILIPFRTFM